MCTDLEQEMLRIDTRHLRANVDNLLPESSGKSQDQVYLAGQQSDQITWKYMNGTVLTRQG